MEDLTGKEIGPYRIVGPLGAGGMAAVYKAYQEGMDRHVALKILPQFFAGNPEFVKRFDREAKLIAGLQHPRILPVHDYGKAEDYNYLVMSLVDTGTLEDVMAKGPASLDQVRDLLSQVGDALDYAHSKGVIHRDIKPSNILMDPRGNCLLTDFGIAKMVEGMTELTKPGGIVGTPSYMSPEQGLGEEIDGRSDIYSLGVILYQMATGRLPFTAETPVATVLKHVNDPLPPPRAIKADLPRPVEAVILKAMAKSREERYPTAGAFVKALDAAIPRGSAAAEDDETIAGTLVGPAIGSTASGRGGWRSLPLPRVAAIAGGGAAVLGAILWLTLSGPDDSPVTTGEGPKAPAGETMTPYDEGYRHLKAGNLAEAQSTFETIANRPGEDSNFGREGMAAVSYEKNEYDRAAELVGGMEPVTAYAYTIKGNILFVKGEVREAAVSYREALKVGAGAPWQMAVAYNRLGRVDAGEGRTEEALANYDRALSLNPAYAEAHSNRGVLLARMDKPAEATAAYRRAVEADPADLVAMRLMKEMEQRQSELADQERKKRVDTLVGELAQRYREGKFSGAGAGPEEDAWTSRPLALSFLPFKTAGTLGLRDGTEDFLLLQLTDLLQESGRVTVVERMILDDLLQALSLASSELADQATALKLGKVLGARLVATGSIARRAGRSLVSLRLVETETTAVMGAFSAKLDPDDMSSVEKLAARMTEKIEAEFPLRGLVSESKGDGTVVLNVGSRQGVTAGLLMKVIADGEPVTVRGKVVGRAAEEIGFLEITSVDKDFSFGKVLKTSRAVEEEMKVEEAKSIKG
jgi:tetratricopeptide (TPR) repeat protein